MIRTDPGSYESGGGGDILSDQSTCRILEPDGTTAAELIVEGWTSVMTSLAFGECGGSRLVVCGENRGRNLHLFAHEDARWERRWLKRLGGQVTGIHVFGTDDRVLAATSQGFLLCYDLLGDLIWHRLLDQGIWHMVPIAEGVLVVDTSGGLTAVTASGSTADRGSLPAPCTFAAAGGSVIYLASGSEVFRL